MTDREIEAWLQEHLKDCEASKQISQDRFLCSGAVGVYDHTFEVMGVNEGDPPQVYKRRVTCGACGTFRTATEKSLP